MDRVLDNIIMYIMKIFIVGVLGFFQGVWLVCRDIQGSDLCPVQPFENPVKELEIPLKEIKEMFTSNIHRITTDRDIINILAVIGLLVTISEGILLVYYLAVYPFSVITGVFCILIEIAVIACILMFIFRDSLYDKVHLQSFTNFLQQNTGIIEELHNYMKNFYK